MKIITGAIIGLTLLAGCSSTPTTTWSAKTYGTPRVVNPGSVNVAATVTNTGSTAAKPNCTVNVSDPSGAYTGFDSPIFDVDVAPGASKDFNMNIVVTHDGAAYVTKQTISCK